MKKRKLALLLLLSGSLVLSGCAEETMVDNKPETLEEKTNKEDMDPNVKEKSVEEEQIVVNVIDPNTNRIIKTFKPTENDRNDNNSYKEEVMKWARETARGTETTPGYDKRNILDRIGPNGQIIKGSPRIILEEDELVKNIMEASENGGEVTLPISVTESNYKSEDVVHLSEVVVASYTTQFNQSVAGRTKNIELSAQAINNVIVGINDFFSFYTAVGPSDEAHGYQPAEEALNGKLVMGIGGGICQTSSTLYNAVDQLKVSYIEKHHHSVTVGYVPKGRDATVSYGGKDFRFQNTTKVPFLINAIIGKGTLTVEIRTAKQYESNL